MSDEARFLYEFPDRSHRNGGTQLLVISGEQVLEMNTVSLLTATKIRFVNGDVIEGDFKQLLENVQKAYGFPPLPEESA